MYNDTNLTDANNLYEMWVALDQLSGGLIGILLMVAIFLIIFVAHTKREKDTKEILLVTALQTSILSIMFWAIRLVQPHAMIFPILVLFAAIIIHQFSD